MKDDSERNKGNAIRFLRSRNLYLARPRPELIDGAAELFPFFPRPCNNAFTCHKTSQTYTPPRPRVSFFYHTIFFGLFFPFPVTRNVTVPPRLFFFVHNLFLFTLCTVFFTPLLSHYRYHFYPPPCSLFSIIPLRPLPAFVRPLPPRLTHVALFSPIRGESMESCGSGSLVFVRGMC